MTSKHNAWESLLQVKQRLQSISADSPIFIPDDFNLCSLDKTLRDFYQYVSGPTKLNKMLDLFYNFLKGAYKVLPLPPQCGADHNCVQLLPSYCTALRSGKTLTKHVKNWTEDPIISLQPCYRCTYWNMFKESCSDIDELCQLPCLLLCWKCDPWRVSESVS